MGSVFSNEEGRLLEEWVVSQETKRLGKRTTITCLELFNGVEVLGYSYCGNEAIYSEELERDASIKQALSKIRDMESDMKDSSNVWF